MARAARTRTRRLGRRFGVAVFALLVGVPTLLWTRQIMLALFFPAPAKPPSDCRAGLLGLLEGVEQAQAAARKESAGERESLSRFRAALGPAWQSRAELDALCGGRPEDRDRLREIDALR